MIKSEDLPPLRNSCVFIKTTQSQKRNLAFQSKHIIFDVIAVISLWEHHWPLAGKTDGMRFVFMHERGCHANANC